MRPSSGRRSRPCTGRSSLARRTKRWFRGAPGCLWGLNICRRRAATGEVPFPSGVVLDW